MASPIGVSAAAGRRSDRPVAVGAAPTIDVRALRLTAGGGAAGRELVASLDARIEAGQVWTVVGPNGSGKSSLLASLAGIFPVAAGSIRYGDRAIADWPMRSLAAVRAWCPQFWSDPFPASVRETASLARPGLGVLGPLLAATPRDPPVEAMLDRLDLASLADADVRTLSGGERQRVALATALLQAAPIVLLDEPTAHLDLAHRRLFADVIADHAEQGGAAVIASHDLQLAVDIATHAIVFDGRGAAAGGACDDVLTDARLSDAFRVSITSMATADGRALVVAGRSRR